MASLTSQNYWIYEMERTLNLRCKVKASLRTMTRSTKYFLVAKPKLGLAYAEVARVQMVIAISVSLVVFNIGNFWHQQHEMMHLKSILKFCRGGGKSCMS